MRVIIDTDPGIDDAIAIFYALRHPDIDVALMTTVAGNIGLDVTSRNAGRIATLAGVETPVHAGAATPLTRAPDPELAIHGTDGLGGVTLPDAATPRSPVPALEAMAAVLMAEDANTIDLLCLAPLTNIALLLDHAPEAASRIRRVIAMGGAIFEPGNVHGTRAEFNIAHDPEAAARVLRARLPLTLIPLDATRQIRADADYVASLRALNTSAATTCADLIDAYFDAAKGRESRPLHDPCVPLLALHPALFTVETYDLAVDLATGALIPGKHEISVAMSLDADALRNELRLGLSR